MFFYAHTAPGIRDDLAFMGRNAHEECRFRTEAAEILPPGIEDLKADGRVLTGNFFLLQDP
jgi:hypothetical protein